MPVKGGTVSAQMFRSASGSDRTRSGAAQAGHAELGQGRLGESVGGGEDAGEAAAGCLQGLAVDGHQGAAVIFGDS